MTRGKSKRQIVKAYADALKEFDDVVTDISSLFMTCFEIVPQHLKVQKAMRQRQPNQILKKALQASLRLGIPNREYN